MSLQSVYYRSYYLFCRTVFVEACLSSVCHEPMYLPGCDLFCRLPLVLLRIPAASNLTYAECSCACARSCPRLINTSKTLTPVAPSQTYSLPYTWEAVLLVLHLPFVVGPLYAFQSNLSFLVASSAPFILLDNQPHSGISSWFAYQAHMAPPS